jgi:hypothetical protein
MLTLSPKHMQVFSEAALERFEEMMVAHLKKFFPDFCDAAGEEQLRETIHYGIERAAAYRITAACDVCKYIDLMVVLGCDFDTDKELPWAGGILKTRNTPGARMSVLVRTADKHLRHA